jgi:branched-chain amino acid transport system ATP-binding protein
VLLEGRDVTRLPAHRRVRLGIALVPEGRRLFPGLTVAENLLVARDNARPGRRDGAAAGPWDLDAAVGAFPLLKPLLNARAASLSGGEQQATAIARALMTNPRVVLLDEVSLGLAPAAVDAVYRSLPALLDAGTGVVLVEQDLARAMRVADRIVCMLEGRVVLTGAAGELTREQITEAYFGARRPARAGGGTGPASQGGPAGQDADALRKDRS